MSGSAPVNIWFWAIVGLPTLVAGVYYFAIASDLYLSEAKFVVRSPKQVQTSTVGALLQSSGLATRAADDTELLLDFIMSRDAVRKLEQQNDLRAIFGRPEAISSRDFPASCCVRISKRCSAVTICLCQSTWTIRPA